MLSLRSIRLLPASVGILAGMIETGSERWRCGSLTDASQAQHDKSLFFTHSHNHSFTQSLIHTITHSHNHSLNPSLNHTITH